MKRTKFTATGVNLGGWLILEKWLTPSVFKGFDVEDEWGMSQTKAGRKRIAAHRKAFLVEGDFMWLRDHAVKFVRLPVPYWAVIESDEYVSARKEVAWAMKMAEKYNLKVLLDLHAVPGGQNNGDHSGKKGQMEWFGNEVFQEQTVAILKQLAERYKDSPALWGIEIMNEPESKGNVLELRAFYKRAYKELRQIIRPGTYTIFHDGFRPFLFTGSVWSKRHYPVAMDIHWYGFTFDSAKNLDVYLHYSKWLRVIMAGLLRLGQSLVIGEWSTVLPQRLFDAQPTSKHMKMLEQNAAMQQKAYRLAICTMYWNYKAEGDGMWNFRSLVEKGVIRKKDS
ncbi:cellulase family glycosylhydrolase [Candidatus Saccharibacteria bacterium]|nr:cellulase family glycosylhydrolase [Candidatus Saccharibacteria bacterium]